MMSYNEAGQEQTIAHTFEGRRKLRPLVPRPFLFPTSKVNNTRTHLHGPDICSLHQHQIGSVAEQGNNNEAGTHQVVVSSRWNPTPEQLRALEELYRCGTRTPSAEQIQHITAQLRRYGKIEGKNVFYWFQNHKARERQKRRREVQFATETTHFKDPDSLDITSMTDKGSGANRVISIEHEQNKNLSWAPFTSNGVLTQESEPDTPIKGIEKESAVVVMSAVETRHTSDGWIQFDAREFQHHHHHNYNNPTTNLSSSPSERNATWKFLMQPTSTTSNSSLLSLSDESNHNLNHYSCPRSLPLHSPTVYPPFHISSLSLSHESLDLNYWHEERERKSLTLELLPLVRADGAHIDTTKKRECPTATLASEGETNVDYNAFPYYKFL